MRSPALLTLLSVACTQPAARPTAPEQVVHFRDTPADFAQLGLTAQVVPREDGRHTQPGSDEYEWWYLDGVAQDGTLVVVWFGDNWLVGTKTRQVAIEVSPPGKPTRSARYLTHDPGEFSREAADVRIGLNRLAGNLERYEIHLDPAQVAGVGCDLTLTRRVISYRPGTGYMAAGADYFAWLVAVPEGELSGTLSIDGVSVPFTGSGYHDHNWGNVPPWKLFRNWWWGRGDAGGRTVVMSELRPAVGRGDRPLPLLFIASKEGVQLEAHGEKARFTEGPPAPHGDARHQVSLAESVEITPLPPAATSPRVTFMRQGAPTTSADLLMEKPAAVRWLARVAGRSPWYTRWASSMEIEIDGNRTPGTGTLEFMDFE